MMLLLLAATARAQIYTDTVASCNSATTPVSVLAPASSADRTSFTCWVDPTAATTDPVLIWSYNGATPTSIPAGAGKLVAGESVTDSAGTAHPQANGALNEGLACALVSGSTAVNVYCKSK